MCGYCGHRVAIAPQDLDAHAELAEHQAVQDEALQALDREARREMKLNVWTIVAVVTAVVGAPGAIVGLVLNEFPDRIDPDFVLPLQLFVFVVGVVAFVVGAIVALFLFWPERFKARADAHVAKLVATTASRGVSERCTQCGARVTVPPGSPTFTCEHCRTPFIVANGVVFQWTEDARQRAEQWKARAREAFERFDLSPHGWRYWIGLALLFVLATAHQGCSAVFEAGGDFLRSYELAP